MKPIDYPADFEGTVTAALSYPCFIDSRGNLYSLRDDGATVLVSGPDVGTNVRFQSVGSSRQLAWADEDECDDQRHDQVDRAQTEWHGGSLAQLVPDLLTLLALVLVALLVLRHRRSSCS